MSAQRSVGKFCSVVVSFLSSSNFDSVTTLDAAKLGNGAECYCLENQRVYRYDSASTLTSTLSPLYITAATGGGAWVMLEAGAYSALEAYGTTNMAGAPLIATTPNLWGALPSGTNFYTKDVNAPFWFVNTLTGVVTYSGPTGKLFSATINLSVVSDVSPAGFLLDLDLVENGGLLGTTTATITSETAGFTPAPFGTTRAYLSYVSLLSGTNGHTYQPAIRPVTGSIGNIGVNRYKLVVTAL